VEPDLARQAGEQSPTGIGPVVVPRCPSGGRGGRRAAVEIRQMAPRRRRYRCHLQQRRTMNKAGSGGQSAQFFILS